MLLMPLSLAAIVTSPQEKSEAKKPTFAKPSGFISPDAYPTAAVRRGEAGIVHYEVDVTAKGVPVECRVVRSSDYATLDRDVCKRAMNEAFKPARDASGSPVFGTLSSRYLFIVPDGPSSREPETTRPPEEITFVVSRLPSGYRQAALLWLQFDREKVVRCELVRSSGSPAADKVACSRASVEVTIPASRPGKPTPTAVSVGVVFEAGDGGN